MPDNITLSYLISTAITATINGGTTFLVVRYLSKKIDRENSADIENRIVKLERHFKDERTKAQGSKQNSEEYLE
jgi:hypothetical protein